ncbi:MAG TPA: NADH-quinone oxidoreductase subunit M, partial [Actinomycetota bacterium]|nr:NADH-quinone oxidoreductase subunit M [Actinomycetota bacterium]
RYHLGIDGISLWLVLLTTLLMPLCVLASWKVTDRVKSFHLVLLVLETGILGVFLALDLLLFYVFWEGMLIPMYLLIGIWGYQRRVYAAVKFFLYTLTGSLLMLVGIVSLYFLGPHTFDLTKLAQVHFAHSAQLWLFAAFFASFAIKIPIFPFHTWLPDAHTEAPTAGSVLLAGVLLKMGAYGFLRFSFPLFPEAVARFAPVMVVLGVIGIVYGGLVSIVQRDIKRLVAYSSVSHLGFVVLGIGVLNQIATSGSVLQMINHGLTTGALFLLIGMLYQRAHTRQISELGGVNRLMPVFGGLFLITSLASLGLPGLNGFVGEFLILNGSFTYSRPIAVIATSGVVLAAIYLLWAYERVFTGPANLPHQERKSIWSDVSLREVLVVAPLVVMSFVIGIFPRPFLERIEPSVARLIDNVHQPTLRLAGK